MGRYTRPNEVLPDNSEAAKTRTRSLLTLHGPRALCQLCGHALDLHTNLQIKALDALAQLTPTPPESVDMSYSLHCRMSCLCTEFTRAARR